MDVSWLKPRRKPQYPSKMGLALEKDLHRLIGGASSIDRFVTPTLLQVYVMAYASRTSAQNSYRAFHE